MFSDVAYRFRALFWRNTVETELDAHVLREAQKCIHAGVPREEAVHGVALGVPCAIAASGPIGNMLFGLSPHDPARLAMVAVTLLAVGALAGYTPAGMRSWCCDTSEVWHVA